jgi:hypothetical protein
MPNKFPRVVLALCLFLLTCLVPINRLAAQGVPVTLEGYTIDSQTDLAPVVRSISLAPPYMAVAVGPYLRILDATVPDSPQLIADLPLPESILGMAVSGSTLLVAAGNTGLVLIDVSNPHAPSLLTTFALGRAQSVAASSNGGFAYVSNAESQITVVKIKDPVHPKRRNTIFASKANFYDLIVTGKTLIAAAGGEGLKIYSLESPAAPVLVKKVKDLAAVHHIALNDRLVAAADGFAGLTLVNFPSWNDPHIKGTVAAASQALDCAFLASDPTKIVVAEGSDGYRVVDVSDPGAPVTLAQPSTPASVVSVSSGPSSIYLSCGDSGLWNVSLTDPTHPSAHLALPGGSERGAIAAYGSLAYLSAGTQVEIWSFSDPTNPTVLGAFTPPAPPRFLNTSGSLLLASCQQEGLIIYDLADPLHPSQLAVLKGDGTAGQIALQGPLLAIADGSDGLLLADVSIPSAPVMKGTWAPSKTKDFLVTGAAFDSTGNLWVISDTDGLTSLDVSDPTAPAEIGKVALDGIGSIVATEGEYAYAVVGTVGLEVVKIADPSSPSRKQTISAEGAFNFTVRNSTILLAAGTGGLKEFDATDPSAPVQTALFGAPGFCYATDFLASGERILVSREGGVWVLSPSSCGGSQLLLPCSDQEISSFKRILFHWTPLSGATYKIQVSTQSDFPKNSAKTKIGSDAGSKLDVPYWIPGDNTWKWMVKKSRGGVPLYWRVVNYQGGKTFSETRSFTIR